MYYNKVDISGVDTSKLIVLKESEKMELLKKYMDEKEFKQIFNDDQKIIPKKFESKCKKYRINYYKINQTIKKHLQKMLNNKKLSFLMKEEKPLNIILDNARIHTAKIVEEACEILSVNLVYLPPYCPFLSPIEDVWKDIKREIYNTNYKSLDELIELFELKFYEKVDNISYFENCSLSMVSHTVTKRLLFTARSSLPTNPI